MKAVLLAGGYGTRLYPLTLRTPKPLLPVAGRPVLEYSIEMLAHAGITDIFISLKENQRKIEDYFGKGKAGAKIGYVYEPDIGEEGKLGSVGAINFVFSKLPHIEDAIVIGGDNFIVGLNLSEFTARHKERGAHASIALFELHTDTEIQQSGIAQMDESGRIVNFQEKPHPSKALSKLASTAIYALDKAFVREHLPAYSELKKSKGEKADRIGDLWAHFVSDLHLIGHPFEGIWGDVGNCEVYIKTNREAFEHLSKEMGGPFLKISPKAKVAASAKITPPVIIEDHCTIGENALIGPNVHLLHGTKVGTDCSISDALIFERCKIGQGSRISNSIIDGKSVLGNNSTVGEFSVVGYNCRIGEGSRVLGSKVFPGIKIEPKSAIRGDLKNDLSPSSKGLVDSCYWL